MKKILLYSGGLDSWLIDKIWKPDIKIYINIGGSYSKEEMDKLPDDVIIEKLDLSKWELDNKIVPLRNLYFIMIASNYATGDKHEQYEICLGATAGDRVLDKSIEFGKKATDMLNYLYQEQWWTQEKQFRVNLDFKDFTKADLLEQFISMGGQLQDAFHSSFSCYNPKKDGTECWSCKPCFRKFVTFFMQGMSFSAEIEESVYNYLKKNVVPKIEAGRYGRGELEESNIMTTYAFLKESNKRRKMNDGKV